MTSNTNTNPPAQVEAGSEATHTTTECPRHCVDSAVRQAPASLALMIGRQRIEARHSARVQSRRAILIGLPKSFRESP
jgi:hypothetical protein